VISVVQLIFVLFHATAPAIAQERLLKYDTKYYILHTDVDATFADDLRGGWT